MNHYFSLEEEIWRPVLDDRFLDFYDVSNMGRVRSRNQIVTELNGKRRFHAGRIVTNKKVGRYLGVSLFARGEQSRFYMHRLVAQSFIENPCRKPFVNHINFDTHDNRSINLEWVTAIENHNHSRLAGRLSRPTPKKGEDQHCAKFTEKDVRKLRTFWTPGDSITELAKIYGVTNRALYQMLGGNTWKHVDPPVAINWPSKS